MANNTLAEFTSFVINGKSFAKGGLANNTTFEINFPNNIAESSNTKEGGVLIAPNVEGERADVIMRCIIGGDLDIYFQSYLNLWKIDKVAAGFLNLNAIRPLLQNTTRMLETFIGEAGYVQKQTKSKEEVNGDTSALISEWNLVFPFMKRTIN